MENLIFRIILLIIICVGFYFAKKFWIRSTTLPPGYKLHMYGNVEFREVIVKNEQGDKICRHYVSVYGLNGASRMCCREAWAHYKRGGTSEVEVFYDTWGKL